MRVDAGPLLWLALRRALHGRVQALAQFLDAEVRRVLVVRASLLLTVVRQVAHGALAAGRSVVRLSSQGPTLACSLLERPRIPASRTALVPDPGPLLCPGTGPGPGPATRVMC